MNKASRDSNKPGQDQDQETASEKQAPERGKVVGSEDVQETENE